MVDVGISKGFLTSTLDSKKRVQPLSGPIRSAADNKKTRMPSLCLKFIMIKEFPGKEAFCDYT